MYLVEVFHITPIAAYFYEKSVSGKRKASQKLGERERSGERA